MIRARLGEIELGDLLQALEGAKASCVVRVASQKLRGRIHLQDGRIVRAATVPGSLFGEYLVRLMYLSVEQVQMLVSRQEKTGIKQALGLMALNEQLITKEELRKALSVQVMDALALLVGQQDGELLAERLASNTTETPEMVETSAMLIEASSKLDEWRRGKVEPDTVLVVSGNPTLHSLTPEDWSVLELVDGAKRARSIALESDLPEEQVYYLLHDLKNKGLLQESGVKPKDPLLLVWAESALVRRLLLLVLERARYQTLLCEDLEQASRALEKYKPQGIVFQGKDVLSSAKQLRTLPNGKFPPLWVLAKEPPHKSLVRDLRMGYIPLPFRENQLLEALSSIKRIA